MKLQLNATGVLAIAGVAVAGFVAWRAYRGGQAVAQSVGEAWDATTQWLDQQRANVVQGFNNATGGMPAPGDPVRALLYGDYGYAGIDPVTGQSATDGEWFADEEARRYEYESQAEYARLRRPPPVVGPNGAAFGIYPRP